MFLPLKQILIIKMKRIKNMESHFWGSIKLMPFVYGITIVISFMVAGIIKGLFAAVSFQTTRAALAAAKEPLPVQSETESES
jgi:hypothetical protein